MMLFLQNHLDLDSLCKKRQRVLSCCVDHWYAEWSVYEQILFSEYQTGLPTIDWEPMSKQDFRHQRILEILSFSLFLHFFIFENEPHIIWCRNFRILCEFFQEKITHFDSCRYHFPFSEEKHIIASQSEIIRCCNVICFVVINRFSVDQLFGDR